MNSFSSLNTFKTGIQDSKHIKSTQAKEQEWMKKKDVWKSVTAGLGT